MRPANVELQIEELVLHGFAVDDRYRVGEALEHELARLFKEGGVPPSLAREAEIEHLDLGSYQRTSGSSAEAIGVDVAQVVYRGVTR